MKIEYCIEAIVWKNVTVEIDEDYIKELMGTDECDYDDALSKVKDEIYDSLEYVSTESYINDSAGFDSYDIVAIEELDGVESVEYDEIEIGEITKVMEFQKGSERRL